MTQYNYRIYYDNGSSTDILRCEQRIDTIALTNCDGFFKLNLSLENGKQMSLTINTKKVLYIDEWETEGEKK